MITPDYARAMAAYNRWQNRSLYREADALTDAERKQPCGAFFGSIHGTLSHLLFGDQVWMHRFAGTPAPKVKSIAESVRRLSSAVARRVRIRRVQRLLRLQDRPVRCAPRELLRRGHRLHLRARDLLRTGGARAREVAEELDEDAVLADRLQREHDLLALVVVRRP